MFKKRLCLILVLLLGLFAFACKKANDEKKDEGNTPEPPVVETYKSYSVKVVDIDGEVLAEKTFSTKDQASVLDAINNEMNAVTYKTEYGTSVASISNSIVDANWYLALYENGAYASTGVDGLVIDDGDKFEFVAECWNTVESGYGTMDATDVLVDKIIYSYMKNTFAKVVANSKDMKTVDYWSAMSLYMMKTAGYDANLFSADKFDAALKTALEAESFAEYDGATWGKYFYAARALNLDLTAFAAAYTTYMTNLAADTAYNEYATPFYLSPAYALKVTSDAVTALSTTEYRAGTEWGLDGWNWQMTNLSLFKTFTLEELNNITAADQGNGCSTALMLLPLAANNISARSVKDESGKDLLQLVLDYYDADLGLVKWSKEDTDINYSTNQIYASLMAYKAQRDSGKAVNIFA